MAASKLATGSYTDISIWLWLTRSSRPLYFFLNGNIFVQYPTDWLPALSPSFPVQCQSSMDWLHVCFTDEPFALVSSDRSFLRDDELVYISIPSSLGRPFLRSYNSVFHPFCFPCNTVGMMHSCKMHPRHIGAWFTWPEQAKGTKDKVKRPKGLS